MSSIILTTFGGELPSVSDRSLPDNAARSARNIMPVTDEFRPVAADENVAVSGVANPQTIYRMSRAPGGAFNTNMGAGWVVQAGVANYVKGQLNDDATERTYYTVPSGPPKAFDIDGNDRQLGVPRPSVKPGAVVKVNFTYTADEYNKDIASGASDVKAAVRNRMTEAWTGTAPNRGRVGLAAGADRSLMTEVFTCTNGVPAPQNGADASWLLDTSLGGITIGLAQYAVPYYGGAKTFSIDWNGLKGDLQAIKRGTATPAENLLTAGQAQELVDNLKAALTTDSTVVQLFDVHKKAVDDLHFALTNETSGETRAAVQAFYASVATQQAITDAIGLFCSDTFNAVQQAISQSVSLGAGDGGA